MTIHSRCSWFVVAAVAAMACRPKAEADPTTLTSLAEVHAAIERDAIATTLGGIDALHIVAPLGVPYEREPGPTEDERADTTAEPAGDEVPLERLDKPADTTPRSASEAAGRNAKTPARPLAPTAPAETRDPGRR